jgi:hypothetical protein
LRLLPPEVVSGFAQRDRGGGTASMSLIVYLRLSRIGFGDFNGERLRSEFSCALLSGALRRGLAFLLRLPDLAKLPRIRTRESLRVPSVVLFSARLALQLLLR